MKLPNGERAVVSDRKLLLYLLNPSHPEGSKHARLFDLLLGVNQANAEVLRDGLLQAARTGEAEPGQPSPYGRKYEIRFSMTGPRRRFTILSVWIIPVDEVVPYLVTAYIE